MILRRPAGVTRESAQDRGEQPHRPTLHVCASSRLANRQRFHRSASRELDWGCQLCRRCSATRESICTRQISPCCQTQLGLSRRSARAQLPAHRLEACGETGEFLEVRTAQGRRRPPPLAGDGCGRTTRRSSESHAGRSGRPARCGRSPAGGGLITPGCGGRSSSACG